jgi:hypothetical protein
LNDSPFAWGNFDCVCTLILNTESLRFATRSAREPLLEKG